MNTLEIGTLAPLPPPHRPATACDLHPGEAVTGFCASCLRERLAGLDSAAAAPGRRSTSALKSFFFFKPSATSAAAGAGAGAAGAEARAQPPSSSSTSFLRPELRRCKSFSCGRGGGGEGLAGGARAAASAAAAAFEPQRRSCDVRGRSTLWSLFNQDDRDRFGSGAAALEPFLPASSAAAAAAALGGEIEPERPSLGLPPPCACVLEAREEEDEERDAADEITPADPVLVVGTSGEVGGGEANAVAAEEEAKPMKEHMDLESNPSKRTSPKDLKEIAGSFWLAASVFSKKWQQWRRKQKQKLKKQGGGGGGGGGGGVGGGSTSKATAAAMPPPERPPRTSLRGSRRRRFLDTQSEVGGDASARRSCDTDPRFSLDAGRVSFDDPRFSWDEPRASWDGHLLGGGGGVGGGVGGAGGRSLFTRLPPILSVVEDAPAPAPAPAPVVQRSDGQIPVEEDSFAPGGSSQTRDYYESASRKRRSFERSTSLRKPPPAEVGDPRPATNAKVSPAGGAEFYHLHHASSILDRDFRDFSSNSLRDDVSESFESAFRDSRKGARAKKPNRWSKAWSIWGFIHRRGSRAEEAAAMNGVERSFSETWPELRMRGYDGKILRSNSSLSARSSFSGGYGSMRRGNVETNGSGAKKKKGREEFMLERNRSARYSPSRVENGMLRFYLTPSRSGGSSRRNGMMGNGRHVGSNSFARTTLRLY